ncbi:MAG: 3-dehydroquinate synthase [Thermoplasmata archaeon]
MEPDTLLLKDFGINSTVTIGDNVARGFIENRLKTGGYYIVSEKVSSLYPELVAYIREDKNGHVKIIPDGEKSKSLQTYSMVIQDLIDGNVDRDSFISYIGGGTIGDTAGFVASTYKRGITLEAFPTTLLGMVDSAIGGKNALNHGHVKNVIGTFYDPRDIVCDLLFLKTLSRSDFLDGVAEIIKYGLISDPEILSFTSKSEVIEARDPALLEGIIRKSILIKSTFVSGDSHDTMGKRAVLNLGHTLAHALEAASDNRLSHGVSVAEGMMFEAFVSMKRGVCTKDTYRHVIRIVKSSGIDLPDISAFDPHDLVRFMENDKKKVSDSVNLPLIRTPGDIVTLSVPISEITELLSEFAGSGVNDH